MSLLCSALATALRNTFTYSLTAMVFIVAIGILMSYAIVRKKGAKYAVTFEAQPVANAAKYTRSVPDAFIAPNGHDVTKAFLAYARPIVGALPHSEIL